MFGIKKGKGEAFEIKDGSKQTHDHEGMFKNIFILNESVNHDSLFFSCYPFL